MTKFVHIATFAFNSASQFEQIGSKHYRTSLNVDDISSVSYSFATIGPNASRVVFAEIYMRHHTEINYYTYEDVEAVAKATGRERAPTLEELEECEKEKFEPRRQRKKAASPKNPGPP